MVNHFKQFTTGPNTAKRSGKWSSTKQVLDFPAKWLLGALSENNLNKVVRTEGIRKKIVG